MTAATGKGRAFSSASAHSAAPLTGGVGPKRTVGLFNQKLVSISALSAGPPPLVKGASREVSSAVARKINFAVKE